MFAREQHRARAHAPPARRFAEKATSFEAGSGPVLLRKVCPCGGGCDECAAESQRDEGEFAFPVQAKLRIGAIDDPLEREADRVADDVVRMSDQDIDEAGAPDIIRRTPSSGSHIEPAGLPSHVRQVLGSPGQPMDAATRGFFEPRFGQDFSDVRVHTGANAEASTQAVHALAYTLGRDVVFNAGQYAPHSGHGQRLLAHELTHVVQQRSRPGVRRALQRAPLCTNPPKVPLPSKMEFATDDYLNKIRATVWSPAPIGSEVPLQSGDHGVSVVLIQKVVLNTVCDGIDRDALAQELADSSYDMETVRAVRRFQQTHTDAAGHPLDPDGQVGPLTVSAMDVVLGLPPQGPPLTPQGRGNCYGVARYGPGETITNSNPKTGEKSWVLSNFDVDKHFIKEEHRAFLESTIVPEINASDPKEFMVSIVGEASTTASFGYNLALSLRRERCVSQALRDAKLDSKHTIVLETGTGELRGDLEQIAMGIDPRLGIEDRTKRLVTITLARRVKGDCNRRAASTDFYARVVCDEGNRVRVTIASVNPDNMAYREFIWSHEDWPDGCGMIPGDPPVFAEHYEWVNTLVPLRLAIGDPDNWYADSDFSGDVLFHGYGADQYLVHQVGGVPYPLFRIGMAGTWEDDACNKKIQWVQGDLRPVGKVQCGVPPSHAPGKCSFKPPEACNTKHKQSASKRFNGAMIGGSLPIDKLPWWLKPFIKIGVAVAGVELATKDPGLDPPLARKFVFVGGSISGAGSGLDRFKGAIAPEQDADKPSQLLTGDPDHWYSGSDFDKWVRGELEFFGGSRKIELTTDAGTFKFNNFGCNEESRKYYGAFKPAWYLECPGKLDLEPFEEEECKDDEKCPEKVRLAGHTKFKAKIGRATLASLPSLGRRAAEKFGCHFSAAFVNIQSEDGPEEKQIHREFIVLLENSGCEFNVDKGESTFHALPAHKLATEKPDDIFAGSDFTPAAWLTAGGTLTIIPDTNVPVWFDLPGKYDPACKGTKRAVGLVLPVAAVDCGKAPDPTHDTTTAPSHTDVCNDFKRRNSWVNNVLLDLHDGKYDDVLNGLNSGQLMIPPSVYYDYLSKPGTVQTNALFVGKAPNPSVGPPIRVVAFADIRVVNVYPSMAMDIEFLTDLCAFDETGNVIFVRPDGCMEGVGRKGQTLPVDPKAIPKQKKGSDTDLHTA